MCRPSGHGQFNPDFANKMRAEEIAYNKGYRTLPDNTVLNPRGGLLTPTLNNRGYPRFSIRADKHRVIACHRLCAFQKFGQKLYEPGMEVRHLDGNALNFHPDNIGIGTKSQNEMDKNPETRKRVARAAADKLKKLSSKEAIQLREDQKSMTYRQLIAKYGIAKSTVSDIVNRKTYANIEQPN